MPTYDYACKKCGHKFEEFQSMTAPVLLECPECGTEALQRLIGAGAGLLFKGSGFYLTDYKKSNSSASSQGNTNAASGNGTASKGNGKAQGNGKPQDGAGKPRDGAGKPRTSEAATSRSTTTDVKS